MESGLIVTNKFKREGSLCMEIYTDANCPRLITNKRSTSSHCARRYTLLLSVNLVTCRSKKHNVVARSSAEAKFEFIWRIMDENYSWWSQKSNIRVLWNCFVIIIWLSTLLITQSSMTEYNTYRLANTSSKRRWIATL